LLGLAVPLLVGGLLVAGLLIFADLSEFRRLR
jgi:hypothetical protein